MRIGELAERMGVSTRPPRHGEEQGLRAASRDGNGYRAYGEDAVVRVRQIRRLLAAGLNTEVIGSALRCARGEEARLDLCPELARGAAPRADGHGRPDRRAPGGGAATLAGYLTEEGRVTARLDTLDGVGPARVLTREFRLVCQA